jgi:ribosome recycling factor
MPGDAAMSDPDTILLEAEEAMAKAVDYLKKELRGIRTGRASPALVEFVKVDYYGTATDLKALAAISVPEPTQLLIKPFDAGSVGEIKRAIEASGLGLNPMVDGKQIRLNLPALSGDRRKQLVGHCKKLSEEAKVSLRNVRRDANKHADGLKDSSAHIPEDEVDTLKNEIQDLLKKYEGQCDELVASKTKEIEQI